MRFQDVKQGLLDILGAQSVALGSFRVIGYQERNRAAEEILDNLRLVEVYYNSGEFPTSSGSINGPFIHEPSFQIILTVAKYTEGDLAVLDNPSSTEIERAAALLTFKEATYLADVALDDLFQIVFQTTMNALNYDFGLSDPVANKWIPSFRKDKPVTQGEYVIITGSLNVECRVDEIVEGDIPVLSEAIDTEIITANDAGDDTNAKAGVLIEE